MVKVIKRVIPVGYINLCDIYWIIGHEKSRWLRRVSITDKTRVELWWLVDTLWRQCYHSDSEVFSFWWFAQKHTSWVADGNHRWEACMKLHTNNVLNPGQHRASCLATLW